LRRRASVMTDVHRYLRRSMTGLTCKRPFAEADGGSVAVAAAASRRIDVANRGETAFAHFDASLALPISTLR
jgi:hypothetical protein